MSQNTTSLWSTLSPEGIIMGSRMAGKDRGSFVPSSAIRRMGSTRSDETQDTLTQLFDHSNYPLLLCTKHYLHTGIKFLLCHPPSPHAPPLQAPHPTLSKMLSSGLGQDPLLPVNGLKAEGFVCLALIKMTECQEMSRKEKKENRAEMMHP